MVRERSDGNLEVVWACRVLLLWTQVADDVIEAA
jgi:hypothetical protein